LALVTAADRDRHRGNERLPGDAAVSLEMTAQGVRAHGEDDVIDRDPGGVLDLANVIEVDLGQRHLPGLGEGRVVRATWRGERAGWWRRRRLAIVASKA
jgi:hypothetical protein